MTGAFGYSGARIARVLLDRGRTVRTLTGHPAREHPLQGRVAAHRFDFRDPPAMARAMEGARVLYNTYWIRFERGRRTFGRAVRNTRALFRAAERAGVRRVVHVSIANPRRGTPLPYYRGKALAEEALRRTGLSRAVLRPALLFGRGGVLLNNIAWIARRTPVFPVPGDGEYRVRPIHVDDLAAVAAEAGSRRGNEVVDAVGPERPTYRELVRAVARAVGSRTVTVGAPPRLVLAAARLLGRATDDVVLTEDELRGLTRGLLDVDGPAAGRTRLSRWLRERGRSLGRSWASELDRHYR